MAVQSLHQAVLEQGGSGLGLLRKRSAFLLAVLAVLAAVLLGRLAVLMLIRGSTLSALAIGERTRTVAVPATRGLIYDAEGRLLAGNLTTENVVADPPLVPAGDDGKLAQALALTPAMLRHRMTSGSPDYAVLATGLTPAAAGAVAQFSIPGITLEAINSRYYPNGSLLGPVLGFTGTSGDGLAGLEYGRNILLSGRPGREHLEVDAGGNPLASLPVEVRAPIPGDSLRLTLDLTLSQFAQEVLDAGIRATHAASGRVLMTDPQTGAVLAIAQWPTANPNFPADASDAAWTDSVVADAFPPGSTFKPLTASAALATGTITTQTRFYDGGSTVISGVRLLGWEYPRAFGLLTFDQAIEHSSDIAFMDIGLRLGITRFYQYLRAFGLLAPPPVALPGATGGLVLPPSRVRPLDLAEMAFGQTNLVSAMQLVDAMNAVANGGLLFSPHIVQAVLSPNGHGASLIRPKVLRRVMPTWVSSDVIHAMETVISPQGTGAEAMVPGYALAGKTGTAQLVVNGRVGKTYMSSFIGFGPLPHPKLLALVQLNRPRGAYYGGQIAAPLFAQLMSESLRYLGIAPTLRLPRARVEAVPEVSGESAFSAVTALRNVGLVPLIVGNGPVTEETIPGPSRPVVRGGSVILVLGQSLKTRGAPSGVPDFVGLTMRRAFLAAQGAHVRLEMFGSGVVVRQQPVAASKTFRGQVVRLWLTLPKLPPITPHGLASRVGKGPRG